MSKRFLVVLAALRSSSPPARAAAGSPRPSTAPSQAARRRPPAVPPPEPVDLTIYAAASLKGALEAAKTEYEAANPGTTLTISTDSSAALATQIEQGAPADVFLSADTKNPKARSTRA